MKASRIPKELIIKENVITIMELCSAILSIAASYICIKGLNTISCVLMLIVGTVLIATVGIKRLQDIKTGGEISSFIADNKSNYKLHKKTNVSNLEDEKEYIFLKLSNKMSYLSCYKLQK